jgi:hypothetical protein
MSHNSQLCDGNSSRPPDNFLKHDTAASRSLVTNRTAISSASYSLSLKDTAFGGKRSGDSTANIVFYRFNNVIIFILSAL